MPEIVRKKGVLASGQKCQKEESGNHQNYRFVTIATRLATIHNYKALWQSRRAEQAIGSRSCNLFKSTKSRVQCF